MTADSTVAEAELAREMNGEPAGHVPETCILDRVDDVAAVAFGEDAGDLVLQVEALAEYQGWHYCAATSHTSGVRSSSGRSAEPPVPSMAISSRPRNSSSDVDVDTAWKAAAGAPRRRQDDGIRGQR